MTKEDFFDRVFYVDMEPNHKWYTPKDQVGLTRHGALFLTERYCNTPLPVRVIPEAEYRELTELWTEING